MAWVASILSHSELLLLFSTVAIGSAFARVRLAGVRLGAAAVLFAGMVLSAAAGRDADLQIAHAVRDLGLVLFVYCVGLSGAPSFFSTLRRNGLRLNACVLAALGSSALVAWSVGLVSSFDAGYVAGLFCGALTNTPALGAATERLAGAELSPHAALAYSVSYPFGVLGGVV